MEEEFNLSREESEALKELPREDSHNSKLEDRVTNYLINNNLIMPNRSYKFYVIRVAASILMFLLGYFSSTIMESIETSPIASQYMLILSEDEDFNPTRELPELVEEYENWLKSQSDKGISISGAELAYPESPYPLPVISGFFLVDVSSIQEARSIAKSCPHIKYGGKIEVREIVVH